MTMSNNNVYYVQSPLIVPERVILKKVHYLSVDVIFQYLINVHTSCLTLEAIIKKNKAN